MKCLLFFAICSIVAVSARVPSRNQDTVAGAEEPTAGVGNRPKEDVSPVETPVERSPIDSANPIDLDKPTTSQRRPVSVILFRQPSISLLSGRQSHPFAFHRPSLLSQNHFDHFHRNLHDDPAFKLLAALLGNSPREMTSESSPEDTSSESVESSEDQNSRRDMNPFESLFPNIFPMPRFPPDDEAEKEGEASNTNSQGNFENKEKKVINVGGRKFVKTTQVKKVKNDFGQFHSVISSYQPFDEKIHDENGNEKVKPDESSTDSGLAVSKKEIESSTTSSEKVDASPSSTTTITTSSIASSSSSTPAPVNDEKEEATSTSRDLKQSTPESERIRMKLENLRRDDFTPSKNEIPDKNVEILVDQMN